MNKNRIRTSAVTMDHCSPLGARQPTGGLVESAGAAGTLVLSPSSYADNALEPMITAQTIGFHYCKHHQGDIDNLVKLVKDTEYAEPFLEKIIANTTGVAEKTTIFNNATQGWNYTFYRVKPDAENWSVGNSSCQLGTRPANWESVLRNLG